MPDRCPCRKASEAVSYETCCAPFHRGWHAAPTAAALMRSRYSAYARGDVDYLLATWHPDTRPAKLVLPVDQTWLALKIVSFSTDGDTATVSFVARSRCGGRSEALQETSRFVRVAGRWLYVEGIVG